MSETALTTIENSPLVLIQQALEKGVTGEQLKGLMDFAERLQANQAKAAFAKAFTEFKRNLPLIQKTAAIKVSGVVRSLYAPLDEVCEKLIPALVGVGITHRWKVRPESDGKTTVICYLKHEMGYEEEGATMTAAPDNSGQKNAIQADGSTVSYLQRYTLLASCGVSVRGVDPDGNTRPKEPGGTLDESLVADWIAAIEGSGDKDELFRNFKDAEKAAAAAKDRAALTAFNKAKNETWRKRGFQA